MNPLCSIIVPLYNSPHIALQLSAFARMRLRGMRVECIFVDDGSDLEYLRAYEAAFSEYAKSLNIRFFSLGQKHGHNRVCLARNEGVRQSTSDNIIFLDQDSIPSVSYLESISEFFGTDDVILGASLGYNNFPKTISDNLVESFIRSGSIPQGDFQDFRTTLPGVTDFWKVFGASNTYFRKDVFIRSGGFDEELTRWGDEDVELWYRLVKSGVRIHFSPKVCVLNLSEKLYRPPYQLLEISRMSDLTAQLAKNYRKHRFLEYKEYAVDRFVYSSVDHKQQVDPAFEAEILWHTFYSQHQSVPAFFRIDDVHELNSEFLGLIGLFRHAGMPFILGVEPGNVTQELVEYLSEKKEVWSMCFDITQHGWRHIGYSHWPFQYEFGPSRSKEEKTNDILKGHRVMQQSFGEHFFECFIPPYNFLDNDTHEILAEIGEYKMISSGSPSPDFLGVRPILSLPAHVDLLESYVPVEYKSLAMIIKEAQSLRQRDGFVGFLLHPQHFSERSSMQLLLELFSYVRKHFSPMLFSEFYERYRV